MPQRRPESSEPAGAKISKVDTDTFDTDRATRNLFTAMLQIWAIASRICGLTGDAATVPESVGAYIFNLLPEELRERATYGPFAKLVVLLLVAGLFPTGESWGTDSLERLFRVLKTRTTCEALDTDFVHALTAGKRKENLAKGYAQQFLAKFETFVDSYITVRRTPPSFTELLDQIDRLEGLRKLASASLPPNPDPAAVHVFEAFVREMGDDAALAAIDDEQTVLDADATEADGGSSEQPVLTGDQRTDVQNLYNLVWTMYRTPQLSNTARGIVSSAFESLMHVTYTGKQHWRVTEISLGAAKAILDGEDATPPSRPTLNRAHDFPTLQNDTDEVVVYPKNTHLSRADRRRLVFEPEAGIQLPLDELLRIWWVNDQTSLVTQKEHKEERRQMLRRRDMKVVPTGLFVASGFGVALRKTVEMKFVKEILNDPRTDWRIQGSG